ncbi:MAG: toprim domain-containing protein [Aquificae bacterium]|nr:toprim domain-containing protein [Aquificota bacterium]
MDRAEVLREFLTRLRERSRSVPVIVEGRRDEALLRRFGIKNLYTLGGRSYADLLEELPEEVTEVVLLTDADKQGEKTFKNLKRFLEGQGITVDGSFRDYLKRLGVEEVENLLEVLRPNY